MLWGETPNRHIVNFLQDEQVERARAKASIVFGDTAEQWFSVLPFWLEMLVRRWMLRNMRLFQADTVNIVFAAESDIHGPVVVKMGPPHKELYFGAMAMQAFNQLLVPTVLDWSLEQYALLMEYIGETQLVSVAEPEFRWRIVAPFLRDIPCLPLDGVDYPRFSEQLNQALQSATQRDVLPEFAHLLQQTPAVWKALRKLFPRDKLIHGDVHHYNILLGDDGWKLIDPHGRYAPAVMEIGPFLTNEWEQHAQASEEQRLRIMDRCLEYLSDALDLPVSILRVAASLHVVLSTCWTLEDTDVSAHVPAQEQALDMLDWLHWE